MKLLERNGELIERHPWAVLAISVMLAAILSLGILFIKVERSYYTLLPEKSASVQAFRALGEKFNGADYEYVLLEAPEVTDPRITEFLLRLDEEVMEDPDLSNGQIQTTVSPGGREVPIIQGYLNPFIANIKKELSDRGINLQLSAIDNDAVKQFTGKDFKKLIEEEYLSNPQVQDEMVGKFISGDNTKALFIFKLGAGLSEDEKIKLSRSLEDLFLDSLSETDARVSLAGEASLTRDFGKHIQWKIFLLFLVALAFCVLVLFLALRKVFDTILPILVMFLGLAGTFGMMGWFQIPVTLASIAIIPLLMGTALTYVVPFITRYYEESMDRRSSGALKTAMVTIGAGLFLAAITNVIGFAVFRLSSLPALQEFGIICAAGTILVFVLSITTLPAAIVLREKFYLRNAVESGGTDLAELPWNRKKGWLGKLEDRVLGVFLDASIRRQGLVLFICSVLIILGFTQIRSLKTDSDLRELSPGGLPSMITDFKIEEYFGGRQADLILIEGDVLAPESLNIVLEFENAVVGDEKNEYAGRKIYERDDIYGLADIVAATNGGVIPETTLEVEQALRKVEENGGVLEGTVLSPDRKVAVTTLNTAGAEAPEVIKRKMEILEANSKKILGEAGLEYQIGGITPLTNDLTENVIPSGTASATLSLVFCALLLIIIFRSFIFGSITLTVAIAGIAAQLGFTALMNWPLDVITSMAPALVIGIGVNFGILFTHRFLHELRNKGREPEDAIRSTMMNLGKANTVAALSTVAAFLIIMLSDVVPLSRFGGITAFSIACCLIAAHTMMPALLLHYTSRKKHREFFEKNTQTDNRTV
ncbi:MAG: MMPL family transporter [Actinobacteria bacterium]|nr:MMPL family transporter [Actinomycetota bacterium]